VNATDFFALSPLLLLGVASVVVLLAIAVRRNHAVCAGLTLAALAAAMLLLPFVASVAPRRVGLLFIVDGYALFYMALTYAAGICVALLSLVYFRNRQCYPEEFYILLLLCSAGASAMVSSRHFASFYLGLEVLSVSLYSMIGYLCTTKRGTEASLKYVILAAAAAAFLLFGTALVYSEVGSLEFGPIAEVSTRVNSTGVMLVGFALMLVAFGFKLSIVPFHMWTPDVYEGAPAPVTAYVATVSKGAVFAMLLRYFSSVNEAAYGSLYMVVSLTAVASMIAGNLLALRQTNVKRILAYSSIAHLGYMLVAYLAGGEAAIEAVTCYLVAYFITTLGTFGAVTVLSLRDGERDADSIEDYRGLFYRRPFLASMFALMLLSLAGIPLTVGFIGKLFVMAAGVQGTLWWQMAALVIGSVIGLFYYLRIVIVMASPVPETEPARPAAPAEWAGGAVMAALTIALIFLGVYPTPLLGLIHALMPISQ
jgi:NADH-quinone oxidoreductase subunit N